MTKAYNKYLASKSIILSASTILVGLLGYAYQVMVGRLLRPEEFSLFVSTLALASFAGSPLGGVLMLISRKVSELKSLNHAHAFLKYYIFISNRVLFVTIIFLVFIGCFYEQILTILRSDDLTVIYSLALLILVNSVYVINNGFFQGAQLFRILAFLPICAVSFKFLLTLFVVTLGFGVSLILLAVAISLLAVSALGLSYILRKYHSNIDCLSVEKFRIDGKNFLYMTIANIAFVAMTQVDVVAANYFLDNSQRGVYAAASVLGKTILYLPGGVAMALFPMVAEKDVLSKHNEAKALLIQAIVITLLMSLCAIFFFAIFGIQLATLLYGPQYTESGNLLAYYGLASMPMALVLICEHYLLARGRILFVWLFIVFAPLQLLSFYIWHDNPISMIVVQGFFGLMVLLFGLFLIFNEGQKNYSDDS